MHFHPDHMPSALQLKVYVGDNQKRLTDLWLKFHAFYQRQAHLHPFELNRLKHSGSTRMCFFLKPDKYAEATLLNISCILSIITLGYFWKTWQYAYWSIDTLFVRSSVLKTGATSALFSKSGKWLHSYICSQAKLHVNLDNRQPF